MNYNNTNYENTNYENTNYENTNYESTNYENTNYEKQKEKLYDSFHNSIFDFCTRAKQKCTKFL